MPYKNLDDGRAARRDHYQKNKDEYKARAREYTKRRREELRRYVREIKANRPCEDCEQHFPHFVMDFHHRNSDEKVAHIGKMCHKAVSLARLKVEIEKCDLVCANCHRIRHYG